MTAFVDKMVGKVALPAGVFFCLVATFDIFRNYLTMAKFGRDFGVYWRAANQSLESVYFWQGAFPFPYAPTMLVWIQPLTVIPRWPAYFLFLSISVAALVWTCRPYLSKRGMALVLISPPFARGMFTGQVCALMAALTIWACGTANRVGAGVALGIIATIKPQLVLMAPLMLAINRDWRAFISAATTFAVTILLSIVLFGPERWPEWAASMSHFHSAVADTSIIKVSTTPASVAERFDLPPIPALVIGMIIGAAIIYLCRDAEPLEKAAAITVGSLMAAPYALAYDLTAVMPFLALAITKGRILAALAIGSPMHPVPILISTYELLRGKSLSWKQKNLGPAGLPSGCS